MTKNVTKVRTHSHLDYNQLDTWINDFLDEHVEIGGLIDIKFETVAPSNNKPICYIAHIIYAEASN